MTMNHLDTMLGGAVKRANHRLTLDPELFSKEAWPVRLQCAPLLSAGAWGLLSLYSLAGRSLEICGLGFIIIVGPNPSVLGTVPHNMKRQSLCQTVHIK